jgi:hypothetical protein
MDNTATFFHASRSNDTKSLQYFLEKGINPDQEDSGVCDRFFFLQLKQGFPNLP